MSINVQNLLHSSSQGLTSLLEVHPKIGDTFGPWSVVETSNAEECFYFFGGPQGVCLPNGTVLEMFGDVNQRFKISGITLVKV